MSEENINKTLLHDVHNGWRKQVYPQGWYFDLETHNSAIYISTCMGVNKYVYKRGNLIKQPDGNIPTMLGIARNLK